jgi:hypothetical protein
MAASDKPRKDRTGPTSSTRSARPGDRLVVESERVGQPAREGEILAVHESPRGTGYDVRWDDGRESSFRPAAGSARVIRVG